MVVAVNNNHAILDRASIEFARGFYDALVKVSVRARLKPWVKTGGYEANFRLLGQSKD